jgi:hypothetical protein
MSCLPESIEVRGDFDNSREAVGPMMAVAREAADPQAIPAHHQAVAVVLDLMNPERAGRRSRHLRRLARCNEAGGKDHGGRIEQQPLNGNEQNCQRAFD